MSRAKTIAFVTSPIWLVAGWGAIAYDAAGARGAMFLVVGLGLTVWSLKR